MQFLAVSTPMCSIVVDRFIESTCLALSLGYIENIGNDTTVRAHNYCMEVPFNENAQRGLFQKRDHKARCKFGLERSPTIVGTAVIQTGAGRTEPNLRGFSTS